MKKLLELENEHSRDSHITFYEPTHKYIVDGDENYMSVTTFIHLFFGKFNADTAIKLMKKGKNWGPNNKYFNMKNSEIKKEWELNAVKASKEGTFMHNNIEFYSNKMEMLDGFTDSKEFALFQMYLKDHYNYIPYRTEMIVYSKKYRLAGSIDMIYIDPKDPTKYIIADWKRSKEIKFNNKWQKGINGLEDLDDCNYIHYLLQLNIYRMHLEKYYGMFISEMFLVILHPNQESYIKIPIPRIYKPIIKMLNYRKKMLLNI